VIGNPPFRADVFNGILDRCHEILPEGALAGFILPVYLMQTPSAVMRYMEKWSINTELLPRTLFKGHGQLSKPLMFALFRKDRQQVMVGMALYREMRDAEQMDARVRAALRRSGKSEWARSIVRIVAGLGGSADLQEVYSLIAPKKPYAADFWKEQVRKVCQQHLVRESRGRYALPLAA
jgi:site-specific DNA-methyltransferase (adenine-specific)